MNTHNSANTATLLIHCKDQKGIVVSVTEFIHKNNGNILYLDQHVDHQEAEFFMRVQWDLDGFAIPVEKIGDYFTTLIGDRYNMKFEIHLAKKVPRIAVFVSHLPHCIYDILSRVRSGEWKVDIPVIISNHEKLGHVADEFGIPFHVFSITDKNKRQQEEAIVELLQKESIDTVILARYMQIISQSNYQYSPFIFTGIPRCSSIPFGLRTWSKINRSYQSLCYSRIRCRTYYSTRSYRGYSQRYRRKHET